MEPTKKITANKRIGDVKASIGRGHKSEVERHSRILGTHVEKFENCMGGEVFRHASTGAISIPTGFGSKFVRTRAQKGISGSPQPSSDL